MDPEFSRLVDAAADISTSGRWAAVNARIEYLAANPGVDNGWYVQVLGSLCFQMFSEYLLMKRSYEEERDADSSLLAWRARNLLELSVWSIYCSKSRENARRIYEDAGRDTLAARGNSRFAENQARRINELQTIFRPFWTSTTGC